MSSARASRPRRFAAWVLACCALFGAACGDDEAPRRKREPDAAAAGAGDASDASEPDAARSGEDLFVAANGDSDAPGTLDQPTTLAAALARVESGQAIYLRGGTYEFSDAIVIARENSGTASAKKTLAQYGREAPILNFAAQASEAAAGLALEASHWRITGLIIRHAAGSGILVSGSHNRVERCVVHAGRGIGLAISGHVDADRADWPADDQIINCESLDNEADGFAVLRAGRGNFFGGCVAHDNLGDGWDLSASAAIAIDQSVAYENCTRTNGDPGPLESCSGFRLGSDGDVVAHSVTRSVAYRNAEYGFTAGGNRGKIHVSNALAFDNAKGNYAFESDAAVFANDVSHWSSIMVAVDDVAAGEDVSGSNRFWRDGTSGVSTADFARPLTPAPRLVREQSGDLVMEPFKLAPDSELIDAGVVPDGALPFEAAYFRGKPDLGAFETR